jgi:AraC-like DNA-binding protein
MASYEGYSLDFFGSKRLSDSPYVHWVWSGMAMRDGRQLTAADGNLDFTIIRRDGQATVQLSGPTSAASEVTYRAGDEVFNIRFRPGVYLNGKNARAMLDAHVRLIATGRQTFWFGSAPFSTPTFETAEDFVLDLLHQQILSYDPVIAAALSGQDKGFSERTIQHHFLNTIGLSHKFLAQIRRAEKASQLLQRGHTAMEVAFDTGYSDQSHMIHSLKRFTGLTPSQHRRAHHDW